MSHTKSIEAVIFDWAGTTVDYGCMAPIVAMQEAFTQHGLTVTLDEIRQPMGMLKIDHIKAVLAMPRVKLHFEATHQRESHADDVTQIYQCFEASIFSILNQHTTVIDGVLATQAHLRAVNIKIGATTGYTRQMLDIVAKSAAQQGYQPDFMITGDEVPHGRPYPDMIYQNMMALGIKNIRSVIKVGDTTVDIEEGKNAGCWSVGVVLGSSKMGLSHDEMAALSPEALTEKKAAVKAAMLTAGADFVIDSMHDLPQLITTINNSLAQGSLYAA